MPRIHTEGGGEKNECLSQAGAIGPDLCSGTDRFLFFSAAFCHHAGGHRHDCFGHRSDEMLRQQNLFSKNRRAA